jgi:hypothetical protein
MIEVASPQRRRRTQRQRRERRATEKKRRREEEKKRRRNLSLPLCAASAFCGACGGEKTSNISNLTAQSDRLSFEQILNPDQGSGYKHSALLEM